MLENQGFTMKDGRQTPPPQKACFFLSLGQVVHDKIHLTENLGL